MGIKKDKNKCGATMSCFDRYCGKCGSVLKDCGHTNAGDYYLKSLGCPNCNMRYEMDSRRTPEWSPYPPLSNPLCVYTHNSKKCNFHGITMTVEDRETLKKADMIKVESEQSAFNEYTKKCQIAQDNFDKIWQSIVIRHCNESCLNECNHEKAK